MRKSIDAAVLPADRSGDGLAVCAELFGEISTPKEDLRDIALTNLNPQDHLAIALCNLTRMETGETWWQHSLTTEAVCRFMEALDVERIAIAQAYGRTVLPGREVLQQALDASGASLAELHRMLVGRGRDLLGPKNLSMPFGLVPLVLLAELAEVPVPLFRSGIAVISACYQRDFIRDNDLIPELSKEIAAMR